MGKQKKAIPAKKSIKECIKEIEEKNFGAKNKKRSSTLRKQIQKLEIMATISKKKREEEESEEEVPSFLIQPKVPVGVDPKQVPCVYFQYKMCKQGDKCKYSHIKPNTAPKVSMKAEGNNKKLCEFLINTINKGMYTNDWKCPEKECTNIHSIEDIENNKKISIDLEDYLELLRQKLAEKELTPITEESFLKWKSNWMKTYLNKGEPRKSLPKREKGKEMFDYTPEIFKDDEEADFIDYNERCENIE